MANIDLKGVFNGKQRQFGVQGSGLDRFESDFLDATNRTVNRINRDADLESRIARVTTAEQTLALSDAYEDVVSDGISLYLMELGQRPAGGEEVAVGALVNRFKFGIDQIRQDILNRAQEADTDDESSFVGLGGLG